MRIEHGLIALSCALLVACGGGDDDNPSAPATPPGAGTGDTGGTTTPPPTGGTGGRRFEMLCLLWFVAGGRLGFWHHSGRYLPQHRLQPS